MAARTELDRTTVTRLGELKPENDRDRIAGDLLSERLRSSIALDESGETMRTLRIIGSPFQGIRSVFDIMPRNTEQEWQVIAVSPRTGAVRSGRREGLAGRDNQPRPATRPAPGAGVRRTGGDMGGFAPTQTLFRQSGG